MIGKHFFGALAVAILVASASLTAVAQVGELRGHVWMQQADGQKVPLADAQIDVFRTDMSAKYNTKTNKKGEFVFRRTTVHRHVHSGCEPSTAAPNFLPGVKAGRDIPVELTLSPGDGKRLTFEEIKSAGGGSATPPEWRRTAAEPSAEDKAKIEEMKKKNAEIEASNKKITEANDVIARTFKAGNEALPPRAPQVRQTTRKKRLRNTRRQWPQYDEGLAADADQPAILTNKAVALKGRGVERFNTAVRSKTLDDAGRAAALQTAKDDFKAAAEASAKAVTLIKARRRRPKRQICNDKR